MIELEKISEFNEISIMALEWKRFETLCTEFIKAYGYDAKETAYGADGGIDIKVYKKGDSELKAIVQCKSWNTNIIGIKSIRELLGVMTKNKVGTGIFITTSTYTKDAIEFAKETNIELITGKTLTEKINKIPQKELKELIERIFEGDFSTPTCPKCGVKMKIRETERPFWGCKNYPKCTHKFYIKSAEIIEENKTKQRENTPACPRCKKEMIVRTTKKGANKGQEFWGCKGYPDCRGMLPISEIQ